MELTPEPQRLRSGWETVRPETSQLFDRIHLQDLIPDDAQYVLLDLAEYEGGQVPDGMCVGYRIYVSKDTYPSPRHRSKPDVTPEVTRDEDEPVEGCPDCRQDAVVDDEHGQSSCTECGWRP